MKKFTVLLGLVAMFGASSAMAQGQPQKATTAAPQVNVSKKADPSIEKCDTQVGDASAQKSVDCSTLPAGAAKEACLKSKPKATEGNGQNVE